VPRRPADFTRMQVSVKVPTMYSAGSLGSRASDALSFAMTESDQTVGAIPGYAREFIKTAHQRCDKKLDFSESSVAILDEVAVAWRDLSREDKLDMFDGMCFYLGEVIRRNLGGCWVDPKWRNPKNTEARCYLSKVAGSLTVSPSKWVERRLLEDRGETFLSYYKSLKRRARTIKRDRKKSQSSASAGPRPLRVSRTTSIIISMQLLFVFMGWIICRVCSRICGGDDRGLAGFLITYGYSLALIPMTWGMVMVYINSSDRIPAFIEKSLNVLGFIFIFVIFGLFGRLAVAMITSLGAQM